MATETYTARDLVRAIGFGNDDPALWTRKGWIKTPLANPAPGKARRYSLENVCEYALVFALVRRGLRHEAASAIALDYLRNPREGFAVFTLDGAYRFIEDPKLVSTHIASSGACAIHPLMTIARTKVALMKPAQRRRGGGWDAIDAAGQGPAAPSNRPRHSGS